MFVVTDGKYYVHENPMSPGDFLRTTSSSLAKQFTYNSVRDFMKSKKRKQIPDIKTYKIVNIETGEPVEDIKNFSKEGMYIGNTEFSFDASIIGIINDEVESILGITSLDRNILISYRDRLNEAHSFYDSAISDIYHARIDKRPPAHLMTKIDRITNELHEKRRDVKQALKYVEVLIDGNTNNTSLSRLKTNLSKATYNPYKGRTSYYQMIEDLLQGY